MIHHEGVIDVADKLYVALAAGGTAGHINPALALAEELRMRGHRVVFVGQPTRLEATLVPAAGFDFIPIRVNGFNRRQPWTLASALWHIYRAEHVLATYFKHDTPDVCVGFGAYVELALVSWCKKHAVPLIIHEQNSIAGLANKLAARSAKSVCVSFPAALEAFKGKVGADTQLVVTGNPVRLSVLQADRKAARQTYHIPDDALLLVVFGGSLGAKHLNEQIVARKTELMSHEGLYIIQATGKADYQQTCAALNLSEDEKKRWHVLDYINDMGEVLAACDVVVSRAGASSIAELAALAKPSILVPYPLATADHQTTNAHGLVDAGAAFMICDKDLESTYFTERLNSLLESAELRESLTAAAKGLAQDKAACALADQVEHAAVM